MRAMAVALSDQGTTMLSSHFLDINADFGAFWIGQYLLMHQSVICGSSFLVSRPAQNQILTFLEYEGRIWSSCFTAFSTPNHVSRFGPKKEYLDIASGVSCFIPGRCATA